MKTIKFRPLRLDKKSGKIMIACYSSWHKVKCANYSEFLLIVNDEYKQMDKLLFVHNHLGELLYHFNYNPWDVFVYYGSCLDAGFDWDFYRKKYGSFSIDNGSGYISHHWQGADCSGTPTFSHIDADQAGEHYTHTDINDFEPVTVGYVMEWLSWFLYQLENSTLKVGR